MPLKNTNNAFIYPQWPVQNVVAISTTISHPENLSPNTSSAKNAKPENSYGSFNLGLHVGDDATTVQENREVLLKHFPQASKIQWLNQVHGTDVIVVDEQTAQTPSADAMVTFKKNIALAIMTADCLPILLANSDGSTIAAIHGGWRSLQSGIIKKTLDKMQAEPNGIRAWLGPCIGKLAFEVGAEVKALFVGDNRALACAFSEFTDTTFLADLQLIASMQLQALGVKLISKSNHCTFTMSSTFYSYRRQAKTGRMATIICRR